MNPFQRAPVVLVCLLLTLAGCAVPGGGGQSGTDDGAATREVSHARGTTAVPVEPRRVVVLDTGELDDALALGVTPVGSVTTDVSSEFFDYLGARTSGIEQVGTINEVDLEKVASLRPDLILGNEVRHAKLYDQLSAIAPTVFTETVGVSWKENLGVHADALDRSARATELMADYDRRAAAVGRSAGAGSEVAYVRFTSEQIRLYSDRSFLGVILADVGAGVPAAARGQDTFAELSAETIDEAATADVVLTSTYGDPVETDAAEVTAGPLWDALPAVAAERVGTVDDDMITGTGILAARGLLDDLESVLTR